MAIRQASCEVEMVPSLHSNLAGAASATGAGLAGGVAGTWAGWDAGAGACATNFWKSAQPAHQTSINRARADRTCVASGEISAANRIGLVSAKPAARGFLQHTMAADDSDTSGRRAGNLTTRAAVLWSIRENQVLPGRNDMVNRLTPAVVAFAVSMVLLSTSAHAVDPGFCRQYAKAALTQVRGGLSSPACGGGLQGARWSTDFAVHYEWCLGASFAAAGTERDARTQFLRGCASR
jgi:hypothetical protein